MDFGSPPKQLGERRVFKNHKRLLYDITYEKGFKFLQPVYTAIQNQDSHLTKFRLGHGKVPFQRGMP